jgi:predicted metalloendopeptidase
MHSFAETILDMFTHARARHPLGKKQNTPLWKRCVQQTDMSLGELLGRYYVLQDFPALSKQMAKDIVQRIEDAFLANLPSTPPTRTTLGR